jgi:SHS2 domain-containing protein
MERYILLKDEATADIAFIAYGKNMNQMFENAARAVYDIMINKNKVKGDIPIKFKVSSDSFESLLVKFINKILLYKDYKHIVIPMINVNIKEDYTLYCTAKGEKLTKLKDYFIADVKAVTMHELKIKKRKGLIECKVVLDI